jgi:hypothetical protein
VERREEEEGEEGVLATELDSVTVSSVSSSSVPDMKTLLKGFVNSSRVGLRLTALKSLVVRLVNSSIVRHSLQQTSFGGEARKESFG